jgi:hypothetical protein
MSPAPHGNFLWHMGFQSALAVSYRAIVTEGCAIDPR